MTGRPAEEFDVTAQRYLQHPELVFSGLRAGSRLGASRLMLKLISAGFDAHRVDPLAGLAWTAGDYGLLAERIGQLVEPGRTILFLEGGYDLDALSSSVTTTIAALAGVGSHRPEPPSTGGPGRHVVDEVAQVRRRALEGGT